MEFSTQRAGIVAPDERLRLRTVGSLHLYEQGFAGA
jgi:hypothetical protein